MEYAKTYDPRTGESDVNLAVIDGSGPPRIVTTDTTSAVFGDTTTADDALALFCNNIATGAGDFSTLDLTPASATPKKWASLVWWAFAPKGELLLYNDNWQSGGNGNEGVADIRLVDASSGGAATLIATQAENNFWITPDGARFVFASSDPSIGTNGVYLAKLP